MRERIEFIVPAWPAPAHVRAVTTTRLGGVSAVPFATLNLGAHVGDDAGQVSENRERLRAQLQLPAEPRWLEQVHGIRIVAAGDCSPGCEADGSFTERPGEVCVVLTADCLPLLLCDQAGRRVAAVHAGWRGLCAGVIESAVTALGGEGGEVLAWLGPAIGPEAFEVGPEVREAFLARDPDATSAFRPGVADRWFANLYELARRRLAAAGVARVFGGTHCTHGEPEKFFSFRRDGRTGRMATLIWMEPEA